MYSFFFFVEMDDDDVIPLPKVANPKILGNQSDGNPILSCSASIQDSNVDVKRAVAIPLKNLPRTKNKKLDDSLHKQHSA